MIVYVGWYAVLRGVRRDARPQGPFRELRNRPGELAVGGVLGGLLFVMLIAASFRITLPPSTGDELPGVAPLGLGFLGVTEANLNAHLSGIPGDTKILRTQVAYLLPFEIVSVHLLVVLVGAAYLARAKRRVKQ